MSKLEPFTQEYKAELIENWYGALKCQKCNYEIYYFHNLHNWVNTVREFAKHLRDVHGLSDL